MGGWKSLTKKFELTQNLHEFERIGAILENKNILKVPKGMQCNKTLHLY